MIIGCDSVLVVFCSQDAVDFARRRLQEHKDLVACCKDLVTEDREKDWWLIVCSCIAPIYLQKA